jgi:hypothetical protein
MSEEQKWQLQHVGLVPVPWSNNTQGEARWMYENEVTLVATAKPSRRPELKK